MKRTLIFLWIIFCTFNINAQVRPHIKKIVKKISMRNVIFESAVGIGGDTPETYHDFEELRDKATINELVALTNHNSLVIKGYASWALAERNYQGLPLIFEEYLKLNKEVEYMSGCLVWDQNLADLLYLHAFYAKNYKLSQDSLIHQYLINHLDSVYLYSKNRHESSSFTNETVFKNSNQNERDYERIKQIALNEKNVPAIIALAKYQKVADIEPIKKLDTLAFWGIQYFPHEDFWQFLISKRHFTKDYIETVSIFKNKAASEELQSLFFQVKDNDENTTMIARAITDNNCPFYDSLHFQIWNNSGVINFFVMKDLIERYPNSIVDVFAQKLLEDKMKNIEIFGNYRGNLKPGDNFLFLLKVIEKKQPQLIQPILINYLRNRKIGDYYYETAMTVASEMKIMVITAILLEELKSRKQAYEINKISIALLNFENEEIKHSVEMILKTKKANWDWGNWSNHFRDLAKKYDLKIE